MRSRLYRIRGNSAWRAPSEVEVFCAEKDSGFFPFGFTQGFGGWKRSLFRRAQNDTKHDVPASGAGYAKISLQGEGKAANRVGLD